VKLSTKNFIRGGQRFHAADSSALTKKMKQAGQPPAERGAVAIGRQIAAANCRGYLPRLPPLNSYNKFSTLPGF
jgi:hypothetical protein